MSGKGVGFYLKRKKSFCSILMLYYVNRKTVQNPIKEFIFYF